MRVETSHGDTAVLGHVDVRVLSDLEHLLLGQTGKAEHANLVGNVVPGAGCAHLLELAAELLAHLLYAARHCAEVLFPLGKEGGVVEDRRGDAGAICRRI